jgi:hypothetical protein
MKRPIEPAEQKATLPLLNWLNGAEENCRLERLLKAAQQRASVARYSRDATFRVTNAATGKTYPAKLDRAKPGKQIEFLNAEETVNSILTDFQLVPMLDYSERGVCVFAYTADSRVANPPSRDEVIAFVRWRQLAENGGLWHVRRCAHCNIWFYVTRIARKCCSKKCKAEAKNTPAFREKRRKDMRKYRALLRELDEKAKELANKPNPQRRKRSERQ